MYGLMQEMLAENIEKTGWWDELPLDAHQESEEEDSSTHMPWSRVEFGERKFDEQFSFQEDISHYVSASISTRWIKLKEIFVEKLSTHQAAFEGIDLNTVREATGFVVRFCLATTPEKITVDFTDDASAVITVRYPNQIDAYLEMYYEPGASEPVQHVVLISQNKTNTFAYDGAFLPALEAFWKAITPSEIGSHCS